MEDRGEGGLGERRPRLQSARLPQLRQERAQDGASARCRPHGKRDMAELHLDRPQDAHPGVPRQRPGERPQRAALQGRTLVLRRRPLVLLAHLRAVRPRRLSPRGRGGAEGNRRGHRKLQVRRGAPKRGEGEGAARMDRARTHTPRRLHMAGRGQGSARHLFKALGHQARDRAAALREGRRGGGEHPLRRLRLRGEEQGRQGRGRLSRGHYRRAYGAIRNRRRRFRRQVPLRAREPEHDRALPLREADRGRTIHRE